ncbi:MAG: HesA/MoeB/ThiF family protein [Desulfurococcaceae archaeon]
MLNLDELERYERQIRLFGVAGQEKLKSSKITVVGVGGLGSPIALYLVAAGVGEIRLVDFERVELSNLNRQILHWTDDISRLKVESAAEKLCKLNPNVRIRAIPEMADASLLEKLVPESDLVIDALDNWKTRLLLNKICLKYLKPLIHGGVYGLYGQVLVVVPGLTPCLQCILPKELDETKTFPIIGSTSGLIAMIQVTEAIKLITGYGKPALNKLIMYDGYSMDFNVIYITKNPKCPACSEVRGS